MAKTDDKQIPQAPGAPAMNAKPGATGAFASVVLVIGLFFALGPSEGGRQLKPYKDHVGIPTACLGIIGAEVTRRYNAGLTFTEAECQELESKYLQRMVAAMSACVPASVRADMTYGEWIALGHWSYNLGTSAFCNGSVAARLKVGDHHGACRAMGQYVFTGTAGNKPPRGRGKQTAKGRWLMDCTDPANRCTGIAKRRELEVSTCLSSLGST